MSFHAHGASILTAMALIAGAVALTPTPVAADTVTANDWDELVEAFSEASEDRTVTLNANITAPAGGSLVIPSAITVTLNLAGQELEITDPGDEHPAIGVPSDAGLVIIDTPGDGTLTVQGAFSAAGIGGGTGEDGGTVEISDGVVIAQGGDSGAGIGGGAGLTSRGAFADGQTLKRNSTTFRQR